MKPLVAVGDLNWDVLAKPDHPLLPGGDTTGRVQLMGGGSSANLAVWAARVGYPAVFVGKIGEDRFGQLATEELQAEGVDAQVILSPHRPTGVILVLVDARGERSNLTSQGADFDLLPSELPKGVFDQAAHVHITAWSLFTDPPRQAALKAAELAHAAGATVSLDPGSYQMIQEFGPRKFRRMTQELRPHFVLPNLEEGKALSGYSQPNEVLEALRDYYPQAMVLLKLAERGAMICTKDGMWELSPLGDRAIDATGAGDSFGGAFLGHYLRSHNALAAGQLAIAVSGWVVSRFGARPPIDAQLKQRLLQFGLS